MISLKQVGVVAAQAAIAGAGGFAVLAYNTKTGFGVSRWATGSLGALIFGGNLAIYYAVGAFGEAHKMTSWKVNLLQAGTMLLYDVALVTTCVALGLMTPGAAIFTSFLQRHAKSLQCPHSIEGRMRPPPLQFPCKGTRGHDRLDPGVCIINGVRPRMLI